MNTSPNTTADVILCSTARLARNLRLAHNRAQAANGLLQWQPLLVMTLAQWLDEVLTQSMLTGEISPDSLPAQPLNTMAERLLWEQVIEQNTSGENAAALFDIPGMAQSAAEANSLMLGWSIKSLEGEQSEETRHFLQWREAFRTLCRNHNTLESARLLEQQIDYLKRGAGKLPNTIALAGFDRISPQQQRLIDVLQARNVSVTRWNLGLEQPASAAQIPCDDAENECRAAVAWVASKLRQNPRARLAIVAPELGTLRARLIALLDDTLHPIAIHPAHAETPRIYDFSLGEPLSRHPLVATALALLRFATQRYRSPQQEVRQLLRNMYWSRGISEADARARLEARMRRKLPATMGLEQLLRFVRKAQLDGMGVSSLLAHLETFSTAVNQWPKRQPPALWSMAFAELLKQVGWPGERSLSSHEFQAQQAWKEVLAEFAGLDTILGKIDAAQAMRRLAQLAGEHIFQPEAENEAALQIMGMLEATSAPLDAVWGIGMNDHLWPPPARPNPLLPAALQRSIGVPNSSSRVQEAFARTIHQRLLRSAPEVVFSWAHKDGERELRASPLLQGTPLLETALAPAATLAEQLAQPADMQWLADNQAPPVAAGEKVSGGAGLLKAQAVCPAWGYYQYRLGARALDEPAEGLDSMDRGNLLHAVLQCYWTSRTSADLLVDDATLASAVAEAVEQGLQQFSLTLDEPLPPNFIALEKLRLQTLLTAWLKFEKERGEFAVQECERQVSLEIAGIKVDLKLDRVDELPDKSLVVLDYKTGGAISHKSWAEDRITEPQLPIYAALALIDGEVAAVCFAKVRAEEQKFIGISDAPQTLPGVNGLEEARKLFPEDKFPHWHDLLQHWHSSITAIAAEIRTGEAAVRFDDENDLTYCDVKPLLRLPERKLQFERRSTFDAM